MSIKRTKEQKRKAQQLRMSVQPNDAVSADKRQAIASYSFTASTKTASTMRSDRPHLSSDPAQYVGTDLRKTVLTASLLFIVLLGIYFYLRYN